MEKAIIAAVADNMAIGKDGSMPWHISEDMKFFKSTTLWHPVIMGSATFRSLGGKPLPKRLNIVISRNPSLELPEGVLLASSLEDAYGKASQTLGGEMSQVDRCFVMGGGQIYAEAINSADVMFITHVHTIVEGADTFFPQIDHRKWKSVSSSPEKTDEKIGLSFKFVEYKRR